MSIRAKNIIFLLLSLHFCLRADSIFAQKDFKNLAIEAEKAFNNSNFEQALNLINKIPNPAPDLIYKKALTYYRLNTFDSSFYYLNIYLKHKKHNDEAIFYCAHSLHYLENYKKAAELYRLYLKVSSQKSRLRDLAKIYLMQAANAEQTKRSDLFALFMPLSEELNSNFDDFAPIQNSRYPDMQYFSTNRNGHLSVYSEKLSASNNETLKLDSRYNQNNDQFLVAFPDNGYQILYLSHGKLRIDNFMDGFENSLSVSLQGLEKFNITDAHLINDSLLLFSSDKSGGYGGLDIYTARKNEYDKWIDIKNLGPFINSVFDERSAFITDNSNKLYFSSNRPESQGGFDVFVIDLQKNELPVCFSAPLNSAGDELFFRVDNSGKMAWISSIRNNGLGAFDNYRIIFREKLFNNSDSIILSNLFYRDKNEVRDLAVSKEAKDSIFLGGLNFDSDGKFEVIYEKVLEELSKTMQSYPDLKLIISGHCDDSQRREISLMQSLNQAEKAAYLLQKKGVSDQRIYIRGLAEQYPAAKNKKFDNSPDLTGMTINNRIEFNFIKNENNKPVIIFKEKMVSKVLKEKAAEKYLQDISGLTFKIELVANDYQKNFQFLSNMNDVAIEKNINNPKISFCVGLSRSFDAILILLETIRESGFENAIIRAYRDGFPLIINSSAELLSDEPELKKYRDYLIQLGR